MTPQQLTLGMVEAPAQSDTSEAAATAIAPDTGRLRMTVLSEIARFDGLTDEEGVDATGIPPSTYRPRRVELHKGWRGLQGGYIEDSGDRRPTRSGRGAIVWTVTEKGRAALRT